MNLRPRFLALATAAMLTLAAGTALAITLPPMLPLDVGNQWEYQSQSGALARQAITGTLDVLGRTVAVKHEFEGPDPGLDNWWMTGPAGEVLLAGFDNPVATLSIAYDPPIVYCGAAPVVGDTWTTHIIAYDHRSGIAFGEYDITIGAIEAPTLVLPAGRFDAIGVAQVAPPGALRAAGSGGVTFTLDGRRVAATTKAVATAVTPSDWFSRGVGLVQWGYDDLYRLTGFGNPTPTLATTWGRLKALYR